MNKYKVLDFSVEKFLNNKKRCTFVFRNEKIGLFAVEQINK